MLSPLKKLFGNQCKDKVREINDAVLGKLKLSEEGWWEANIAFAAKPIGFKIGGAKEPDISLLAHARDIIKTFAKFEKTVTEFLRQESKRLKPFANEIQQLVIEDVMLTCPERTNDGMIYFRGDDELRVWRCDYIDRKPSGLGFDD